MSPTRFCRICLKSCNKNFQKMEQLTFEIMDILLIKPKSNVIETPAICSKCSSTLHKCFNFKSTCFYIEEFLCPFQKTENPPETKLDFKELYLSTKNLTNLNIPSDQKMCRFCMELIIDKLLTSLADVDEAILKKCLPELSFTTTKDPAICNDCHSSLNIYADFINKCAQAEKKIAQYRQARGVKKNGKIALTTVMKYFEESSRSAEKTVQKPKVISAPDITLVKQEKNSDTEPVFIKQEDIWEEREAIPERKRKRSPSNHTYEEERENLDEGEQANPDGEVETSDEEEQKTREYTCDRCPYRTSHKENICHHRLSHVKPTPDGLWSCDSCSYSTTRKHHLTRHVLIHYKQPKKPKQPEFRKCPVCLYVTPIKANFKSHMETHEDPAKFRTYECQLCPYKSKTNTGLTQHMRKHLQGSVYACEQCPFRSKYSESYRRHVARHKDPSEQNRFRCAQCDFSHMHKWRLRIHIMREHMDPAKATMYRCADCDFSTFYKSDHKRHLLKHKDRSEVTMYRCEDCEYETPHRKQLKYHRLVHQDESQVRMYSCELCEYKTKRQGDIRSHTLKHQEVVELFECHICGLTCNRKSNLVKHIARHQIPEEVHKCEICGRVFCKKGTLLNHMKKHQT